MFGEIKNKKVYYNYKILEELECGIQLSGNEVKSIRDGMANIKDAWVTVQGTELVLRGMHIKHWSTSNKYDLLDEDRERKLLAHKNEILKFKQKIMQDGLTLVPIEVYFNKQGKCKVKVGLAQGKHNYDKRETLKEKRVQRDINRALKKEILYD